MQIASILAKYKEVMEHSHGWDVELQCNHCGWTGVPLYNGWFLTRYCPEQGEITTEPMWLIYALIAMSSTVLLVLARGWIGKDFKTKHEG